MTDFTSMQEIEAFFAAIPYKKKDFPPFEMLNKALDALNNPQHQLQYVQITGTNGKGSTANYLSHFLVESDLAVGLFTSPHLFMLTERIKVNNQAIPVATFIEHFNHVYHVVHATCKLIQFEWLYLVALDYFITQDLDIVILEVGIGGRYDTTNTIPRKLAGVITNISYDHRTLLGDTLEAITEQKRAIITDQTALAFIGNITDTKLLALIDWQLRQTKTPAYFLFKDFWFDVERRIFYFFDKKLTSINTALPPYQYENITLALAVADKVLMHFNKPFQLAKAQKIIDTFQMPIRFEIIQQSQQFYVFDGAHNLAGLNTLLQALQQRFSDSQYVFVYAAMADKDYREMLDILAANGEVILYDFHSIYTRAFELTDDLQFPIIKDEPALKAFLAVNKKAVIVFVGSMYFVSYIRDLFKKGLVP